ncbi:MAG TPA: RebB family R body protein [Skermanella sp.]|jgi:hypothetical protein|nr:RebB family R body protein [Skermanella sp.]
MPDPTNLPASAQSVLTGMVLEPAPRQAASVVYTQLAQAIGIAMQNHVSQHQSLNTIITAVTTRAFNLLLEQGKAEEAVKLLTEMAKIEVAQPLGNLAKVLSTVQEAETGTTATPSQGPIASHLNAAE